MNWSMTLKIMRSSDAEPLKWSDPRHARIRSSLSTAQSFARLAVLPKFVAPSKQLSLLQMLAVATLKQGTQPGNVLLSAAAATQEDSDWLEDRDTEMC